MDTSNWNDASNNFRYVKHFSKDVLLLFVNVVRATTLFSGTSINPALETKLMVAYSALPTVPKNVLFKSHSRGVGLT